MPIPIEKLTSAQRPLPVRILEFLRSKPEQAFALAEVLAAVEGYSDDDARFQVAMEAFGGSGTSIAAAYQRALEGLVTSQAISAGSYQGVTHYAVVQ